MGSPTLRVGRAQQGFKSGPTGWDGFSRAGSPRVGRGRGTAWPQGGGNAGKSGEPEAAANGGRCLGARQWQGGPILGRGAVGDSPKGTVHGGAAQWSGDQRQ
jgi:hypothetical protein